MKFDKAYLLLLQIIKHFPAKDPYLFNLIKNIAKTKCNKNLKDNSDLFNRSN